VDGVADQLGASSAQVALAWVRQRDRRIIPITGIRTLEQLEDVLGCLEVELPAEHLARLGDASRIELGFPYELLTGPQGQLVYGDRRASSSTATWSPGSSCRRRRRSAGDRAQRRCYAPPRDVADAEEPTGC
jgi:Aldo/keto reductase family